MDIDNLALVGVAHAALNDRPSALADFLLDFRAHLPAVSRAAAARKLDLCLSRLGIKPEWQIGELVGEWLLAPDNHLLFIGGNAYPELLAATPRPPPVLMVRGAPQCLQQAQIAIVGSRRATAAGRQTAYTLGRELGEQGLAVTSGLASGIDASAHRGALDAGAATVAVFGCGLQHVYPPGNRELAAQIGRTGALVSEFPLAAKPTRYTFPRRNRVISGLALGTVVVEAALTSGSLITALQALEQGREVFAVPGPVQSPLSHGCHELIRQGAVLTERAADVLEALEGFQGWARPTTAPTRQKPDASLSPKEQRVLDACGFVSTDFETLLARSGLTAPELSSILTALDMEGLVRSEYGGTFVRVEKFRA